MFELYGKKRRRRRIYAVGTLLILLVCILFAGSIAKNMLRREKTNESPAPGAIEREILFSCAHIIRWETKTPQEWLGLQKKELNQKLLFWRLLAFDQDKIVLRKTQDNLCPACAGQRYLSLLKKQVAIYKGIPGQGRLERIISGIQVNSLPKEELEDLHRGIPVSSDKEILQIIEGWSEKTD